MKNALHKFLKTVISEKYPTLLDLFVYEHNGIDKKTYEEKKCYEVYVFFSSDDTEKWKNYTYQIKSIYDLIEKLSKYMGVMLCGVWVRSIEDEEYQNMKKVFDNKDQPDISNLK
jgi:hypothetical protein